MSKQVQKRSSHGLTILGGVLIVGAGTLALLHLTLVLFIAVAAVIGVTLIARSRRR